MPDQADDEYVKQLARLLKTTLNKDRNVYVEYSNEVWNSIFPQYGHNLDAAKRQVAAGDKLLNDEGRDDNQYYWGWKRISQRIVQISEIFRREWGDDAINTRIRPVLASQSANPFMTRMQVDFIAQKIGPPSKFIYGIAGAPYLGPDGKFNARDDMTLDDLFQKGIPDGFVWVKDCIRQYWNDRALLPPPFALLRGGHGARGRPQSRREDQSQSRPPHRTGDHRLS